MFFFEKKNQKTFDDLGRVWGGEVGKRLRHARGVMRDLVGPSRLKRGFPRCDAQTIFELVHDPDLRRHLSPHFAALMQARFAELSYPLRHNLNVSYG